MKKSLTLKLFKNECVILSKNQILHKSYINKDIHHVSSLILSAISSVHAHPFEITEIFLLEKYLPLLWLFPFSKAQVISSNFKNKKLSYSFYLPSNLLINFFKKRASCILAARKSELVLVGSEENIYLINIKTEKVTNLNYKYSNLYYLLKSFFCFLNRYKFIKTFEKTLINSKKTNFNFGSIFKFLDTATNYILFTRHSNSSYTTSIVSQGYSIVNSGHINLLNESSISGKLHSEEGTNKTKTFGSSASEPASANKLNSISVIIPTFNRIKALILALNALNLQIKDFKAEVIIINTGNPKNSKRIEKLTDQFKNLKIKLFNLQGSHQGIARNLGIEKASEEILLFIDDDIILENGVLKKHLSVHNSNTKIALCGITFPYFKKNNLATEAAELSHLELLITPSDNTGYSGHLSVKKSEIENIKFSKKFIYYGYEDMDFVNNLANSQIKVEVAPGLIGFHYKKHSIKSFLKRAYFLGRSAYIFHAAQNTLNSFLLKSPFLKSFSHIRKKIKPFKIFKRKQILSKLNTSHLPENLKSAVTRLRYLIFFKKIEHYYWALGFYREFKKRRKNGKNI